MPWARIESGDWFFLQAGVLLRPSFAAARQDPIILKWFEAGGQLDYWLETGHWPDYCTDPELSYDCADAAREFKASQASDAAF